MIKQHKQIEAITIMAILSCSIMSILIVKTSAQNPSDNLLVKGLVSNVLNLTYSEVEKLPMISEIVSLQCIGADVGRLYNWTGVPLFYLLNLAKVQPGAKEVVFRAEDNFSSSLTLDVAMHPTTILALKVNGSILPFEDGYFTGGLAGGYPYKVVVPNKYGYKWVGWIDEIEIVDYDYRGFYENRGFSDDATIVNSTGLPTTTPAYTVFNATWQDTYTVTTFTNATLNNVSFNQTMKSLHLNIAVENGKEGLVHIIIPKRFITKNFTITSDNNAVEHNVIQSETNSFVYFTLNQGEHAVEIEGMLLSDITGSVEGLPDGKVDMKDIGIVVKHFGSQVGDQGYVMNYDVNSDGKIDMKDIGIVVKDFGKSLP